MTKRMVRCACVALLLALAPVSSAAAQYDWESGGGSPPPDGSTTSSTQTTTSTSSASTTSTDDSPPATSAQGDDHQRVVGHLAVGYLGITNVPMGTIATQVTAPAIGVRYWLMDLVGIDVGLGFGYQTGNNAGMGVGDGFGLIIHGGVPLALAHAEHFVFEVTPETNIGFTSGHTPNGPMIADTGLSGVLFQLGGRVGTELHFGFIGVPQLSLCASVGLYFQYQQASTSPPTGMSVSQDQTTLGTTVMGQPWQIFAGTISAFYYFP